MTRAATAVPSGAVASQPPNGSEWRPFVLYFESCKIPRENF
jgi:hypothetical protein